LAVYDGRVHLGYIAKRGNLFAAFDVDSKLLGTSKLQSEAIAAVGRHAKP